MVKRLATDLQILNDFLRVQTPTPWLEYGTNNLPLLLIDHAHCERKAAATAINFMSKYPERKELVALMSPLAREELLHFEKVIALMQQRDIEFTPLQPSGYASCMHHQVTSRHGAERLRDQLVIGAIIEARSCERFSAIIPYLSDPELQKFYENLLRSESRHFTEYLHLAKLYGGEIDARIQFFLDLENRHILAEDVVFRFHSGIPAAL